MIEDMQLRNLAPQTQRSYLHHIAGLARFFQVSPEHLNLEDLRQCQVYLASQKRSGLQIWLDVEVRSWFAGRILPVTESIAEATALEHGLTLVTRNVRDFAGLDVVLLNPWDVVCIYKHRFLGRR